MSLPALHTLSLHDALPISASCIGEQQRLKQLLPGNFEDERVRELMKRTRALGVGAQLPGGKISGYLLVCCPARSEEHTSELQSRGHLVCRLLLEKKNTK